MGYVFGQYELLKRLASGGMGEVFLARRSGVEGFEKLAVIKTLLPHLVESQEFLDMFLDEARLAARLDHPNIGQIFELGEINGTYFIAMEYILGVDLKDLQEDCLERNILIPIPLICRIISDAAAGLHYSHELTDNDGNLMGLVHRDVSPHNILVTFAGGVKIIDFGVAKAANRMTHTSTGQVKGKFAYMPPEQAWGKDVDRRADVFSLGIVMHEMLTRKPLFKAETEVGTIKAVSDCNVPPPSQLNPKVPKSLDPIVLKALAAEPEGRYANAEQFRLYLENWMIKSQTQASQAHLSNFLGQFYKERLEQQRKKGPLWNVDLQAEVEPPKGFRELPPGQDGSVVTEKKGAPVGLIAGVIVLLVVALAAGAFFALKPTEPENKGPTAVVTSRPKLTIETTPPGVSVTLNGRVLGRTPIKNKEVDPVSKAVMELSAPGLVTRKVNLAVKTDLRLSYAMETSSVSIKIDSSPQGVTVKLGDDTIGKTPMMWDATPKERLELAFSRKGYLSTNKTVLASDGLEVNVTLKKAGRASRGDDDDIPTF